eukprot:3935394-Prymnesium_polylepis.1
MPGEASPSAQRAAAEEARMLEELWSRPLPLPAQMLRDRWVALRAQVRDFRPSALTRGRPG